MGQGTLAGKCVSSPENFGRSSARVRRCESSCGRGARGGAVVAHADGHRKAGALVLNGASNLQQQPGPGTAEGAGARRGQLHLQTARGTRVSCTLQG